MSRILSTVGKLLGLASDPASARSSSALRAFQSHVGLLASGMWNTATAWKAYDALRAGIDIAKAAAGK